VKRSSLNRIGKVGRANLEANKRLKKWFLDQDITTCEAELPGCLHNWALTFAHKHKRVYYGGDASKLSDPQEVILACTACHDTIENNAGLTEKTFKRLRP